MTSNCFQSCPKTFLGLGKNLGTPGVPLGAPLNERLFNQFAQPEEKRAIIQVDEKKNADLQKYAPTAFEQNVSCCI